MFHGAMVARGKHEAYADLIYALGNLGRTQRQLHAGGFQQVCAATLARRAAIAMLGYLSARTGRYHSRSGRDIERIRPSPTSATGID